MAKTTIRPRDNRTLEVMEMLSDKLSLEMTVTEIEQANKNRIPNEKITL